MKTTERIAEFMDIARHTCLWCRGTGAPDDRGQLQCEQCYATASLVAAVCKGKYNDTK